jgi:hypothetical protein
MCIHSLKINLFRQWVERSTKDPLKDDALRDRVETWCPNCGNEYYTKTRQGNQCLLEG